MKEHIITLQRMVGDVTDTTGYDDATTAAERTALEAAIALMQAAEAQPVCACGEPTCAEPWEPGCGLGLSPEHLVAKQPACTCPSGDGSLRWPCPAHPPDGDAVLRTAVEYHYAQAALPCDQFGNTSRHPNQKLQAWHKQVADALFAQQPSPSASQVYAHKFATTLQSAAVGEAAILDAERVEAIKHMRFGVVPVEGGGWDVHVYDADGGKETLISSGKDVRHAIDEAIAAKKEGES